MLDKRISRCAYRYHTNVPSSLFIPFLGFRIRNGVTPPGVPGWYLSHRSVSLLAALQFLYFCSDHFHLSAVAWSPSGLCPCCCPCCCQFFSGLNVSIPPAPETADLHTAHRFPVTQLPTSSNLPTTVASLLCCSLGKYFSFA